MQLDKPFLASFCALCALTTLSACGLGGSSDLGDDRAPGEAAGTAGVVDPGSGGGSSAGAGGHSMGGAIAGGASAGGSTDPGAGGYSMGGGAGSGTAGAGGAQSPDPNACGPTTCPIGQVCCNESCGICTPPGGFCTEQLCEPPADAGPVDCSGVTALCIQGTVWSVEDCACVPGEPCGDTFCTGGDFCCNASCGICAPPGGACTQQLCEPTGSTCQSDQDCQLVESYCGGCNCLGLTDPSQAPSCAEPVNCFAAPCQGKTVACVSGTCVVSP